MQVTPKEILTEERLNDLGSAFADCVKELFKDTLPQAKITVYMRIPKYDGKGNMSSAFQYTISDDTVDGETIDEQISLKDEPLRQCFLDKLSPNKDREPGCNWVGYFGQVLTLGDEQPSISNEPIGDLALDESQWIEVIKFAQQKNWYSKIEIIGGAVIGSIIEIPVQEIWELLKAHITKNDQQTDLKDLRIEEILEEIRKHLGDFFL